MDQTSAAPGNRFAARAWPWWRWALAGLSALALVLSVYLSWHYLKGGSVVGCGGGSSCDHVLTSKWSSIRGVLPVSGLAAGLYLAMLVACLYIGPATPTAERRIAWGAMLLLAGAAAGSAVWFTIVQRWMMGSLCPYCMATHVTGLLLAGLVFWRTPGLIVQDAQSGPRRLLGRAPAAGLPLAGLVLAGALVALQVTYAAPPVLRGGQAKEEMPVLEPRAVPLMGSPDAPYIVTMLFDYRCPHCQQMHGMLEEAIRRYDGKVAFVLSPAPLNMKCNPYISRQVDEFKDSCELARISLAVWVAKREAFGAFDRWMFSADPGEALWHGRTPEAARAKAVELVGQGAFDTARADPWIERYMQASVRVFGNTIAPDQSGNAVPKLVFGGRWVTPEPEDVGELMMVLHDGLGVPKP